MSQASGWTIGTVGTLDIRSERNDDAVIGHQRHHIDTLGVETGFNGFGALKVKLRVDANNTHVSLFEDDFPAPEQPNSFLEISLDDQIPMNISTTTDDYTYKIVADTSTLGRPKLYDGVGFSCTIKRESSRATTRRCSNRSKPVNCPATITQIGPNFAPKARTHVHPSIQGQLLAQAIARKRPLGADIQNYINAFQVSTISTCIFNDSSAAFITFYRFTVEI
ncbi:hypothetical protein CAPTEDRAFT_204038 [Capitella teleta]|uniref:Uncharacterized protein n=1 Tax=Capitella teleta TaxID=283909 RepID=R7TKR5_CAPTE|nr:hypothetical protein CAPTEDRAFT_204038 [Capitella teleta]|eukprot:ELT94393.1 hypothetical protein CAPTEDRAFT_204038 [Capitella teleta]